MTEQNKTYPKTVEESVNLLLSTMSHENIEKLKNTPEENLILQHHALGTHIRNEFGLWKGNQGLLNSCGVAEPDDASGVIIKALWEKLRGSKT